MIEIYITGDGIFFFSFFPLCYVWLTATIKGQVEMGMSGLGKVEKRLDLVAGLWRGIPSVAVTVLEK
jgi:hypothetical protein